MGARAGRAGPPGAVGARPRRLCTCWWARRAPRRLPQLEGLLSGLKVGAEDTCPHVPTAGSGLGVAAASVELERAGASPGCALGVATPASGGVSDSFRFVSRPSHRFCLELKSARGFLDAVRYDL